MHDLVQQSEMKSVLNTAGDVRFIMEDFSVFSFIRCVLKCIEPTDADETFSATIHCHTYSCTFISRKDGKFVSIMIITLKAAWSISERELTLQRAPQNLA